MLVGIFFILLFYFIGEVISHLIGNIIPGNVIGMLLLFFALLVRIVPAEKIRPVAKILINNMVFFFIPASVGIMVSMDLLSRNWVAIVVASVVSTLVIIAVVGLTQQKMEDRRKRKSSAGEPGKGERENE